MPGRISDLDAARWSQLDHLFQSAVELPPSQRAEFVERSCSADQLLRECLTTLLRSDSRDWAFVEQPALELAAPFVGVDDPQFVDGDRVGGYTILRLIGRGGMGEVYLARDDVLNRNVALKLLPIEYTTDADRLSRFQREAQAASALNHPNILTIHQLGSVDGSQFIAAEFVEGETLRDLISKRSLSLREVVDVAIQIAGALAAAHKAGIVHRDLKPENIMLRPDGYVKVLDFGLAKLAEQFDLPPGTQLPGDVNVSSTLVMGTLRYMSPEQARGESVDARSDIFSLGVVLYEMVAGRVPFESSDAAKLIELILTAEPAPLDRYRLELPGQIARVVNKAMSKKREQRYQTAGELLEDLKAVRENPEVQGRASPELSVSESEASSKLRKPVATKAAAHTSVSDFVRRHTFSVSFTLLLLAASISFAIFVYRVRPPQPKANTILPTKRLTFMGKWANKGSIAIPRAQAEPAVLDGALYVAGGWWVTCKPYANLEMYDPATDKWVSRSPMKTPRGGHGLGVLNGQIFAVGGSVDCGKEIASVEAYDPASNTWSQKTPLPVARSAHVVAVANGKLYAIGGSSEGKLLSSNTEYDPATNTWTERAPMPTPRSSSAAVVVNNIIYVIGGGGHDESTAVEAYDPTTDRWIAKARMPTGRSDFAVAAVEGIIYAFGGSGNSGQIDTYDPRTDSWTTGPSMLSQRIYVHAVTLNGSIYFAGGFDGVNHLATAMAFTPCVEPATWETKAVVPTSRANATSSEIDGVVYVTGGSGPDFMPLGANEAYDPKTDTWAKKAAMPTPRQSNVKFSAAVDGKFYVIGGISPNRQCTNVNEAYEPLTDTWTTRASMPTRRCHLAVVAVGGLIYAIGGVDANNAYSAAVEVYDPARNSWKSAAPMPSARQDVAATVVNGVIYVVGGQDLSGALNTVESYNPKTDKWTTTAPMPTPRTGASVASVGSSMFVIGGTNGQNSVAVTSVDVYDAVTDSWTTVASMNEPRANIAVAPVGRIIYLMAGWRSLLPAVAVATNEALIVAECAVNENF